MERKLTIALIAGVTFISAIGGGASLLATAPNSTELEPSVRIQQNHTEKAPIAIAGGSWGGKTDGSDDEKTDPPPPKDGDGDPLDGGSWGG
jgi:hypothetical protein